MAIPLGTEAFGSVLSDPEVPDGEQIVWRGIIKDEGQVVSTVTWRVKDRDGRPVYEITTDSGDRKQGEYVIDKSDLRLVRVHILENTQEGESEITIEVKGDHQYLVHSFNNKSKGKDIEHEPDGYNGLCLPFSLRGFSFGQQEEVRLKITPPFRPGMPRWAWRMWKSYVKFLGEEKVTVPAGTFDCYKLEVAASGGLIKRFTSEYYFWFTKEPPHCFVKYQDKDGESVTELMDIKSKGENVETKD